MSTLVALHLIVNGKSASNFVEFVSHKRKYILATDTGLAARRCVAQSLTADAFDASSAAVQSRP